MSDTATTDAPARNQKSKVTHHAWSDEKPNPEAGIIRVLIGTIIGRSTGIKHITMANGDVFEGLKGMFEATDAKTGEVTESGICYLPGGFHELVTEQVAQLDKGDAVEFAYRVYRVPATNAHKWTYAFEPLMPPREADPLLELREMLAKPQAKLNAPGKTGETKLTEKKDEKKAA